MVLHLREDEVAQALTIQDALEAVEFGFRELAAGRADNRPRQRPTVPGGRGMLHLMGASLPAAGYAGFKAYATMGGAVRFLVVLYETQTGQPVALIEADGLGQLRTGAASGVATRYMARPEARVLGVIGAGLQAGTQVMAVCAVRPIEEVRVYSRTPERREAFAARMAQWLGQHPPGPGRRVPAVRPVTSAAAAVDGADVVVTITNSKDPVLEGPMIRPGVHINAAGSNLASRRELDSEAIRRCDRLVVDDREQARLECGDLLAVLGDAPGAWERVHTLADVVGGKVPGRASASEVTLFESQGLAIEDVALAARLLEVAEARGLGRQLPMWGAGSPA